jgi:hypothetical protein
MPFLNAFTGSFSPLPTVVRQNFVFANYGASQGIDNDDGSAFYEITNNVFYNADGFKMDYGGHDSSFVSNLVVTFPYDKQNCLNVASFRRGHGDRFTNNTCLLLPGAGEVVASVTQCDGNFLTLGQNRYFTANGTAETHCGDRTYLVTSLPRFGLEIGSTSSRLPPSSSIIAWARAKLSIGDLAADAEEAVVGEREMAPIVLI